MDGGISRGAPRKTLLTPSGSVNVPSSMSSAMTFVCTIICPPPKSAELNVYMTGSIVPCAKSVLCCFLEEAYHRHVT